MELKDYPEPHGDWNTIPARAAHRGAAVRYPWTKLRPGQWFLFPLGFKAQSAMVMASRNAMALGYELRVFRTRSDDPLLNDRLCCARLDGLPEHIRSPEAERDEWGNRLLPPPTGGDDLETMPAGKDDDKAYNTAAELPAAWARRVAEQPVLQSGMPEYQQMGYDSEEEYCRARGMK